MDKVVSISHHPYLSSSEQRLLDGLLKKISHFSAIKKIYLYGSKARGDFLEESDLDLLFVTENPLSRKEKFEVYDMIFELEVEYHVSVSVVFVTDSEFIEGSSPFLKQIEKDRVLIWWKG